MNLLDSRLQAVLNLIPKGSILLDVGTDHCKLPAEGLRSGHLAKAYASDVKPGPLKAAKKQLSAQGLAGQVELFLSNGLEDIPLSVLKEVTAVSVAGMGGEVMEMILEKAPMEPPLWILQPMSAIYELLDTLAQKGYAVVSAALAQDGEKIYRVYGIQKGIPPYMPDYFGMHQGDPLYGALLEKEEKRVSAALAGLHQAKTPDLQRIGEAEELLKKIRKAKEA
ncbi:MAG: SAM-dependent methyltransferase [Clostridia bacterium]|nr:SAM-dependent methyltransferase [Clostridia bacterium]